VTADAICFLLHLTEYPDMTIEEIKRFRQLGSRTAGQPEYGHILGIEATAGPLGQGRAAAWSRGRSGP
jgi:transketolase